MGEFAILNTRIYVSGFNLSCALNQATLNLGAEEKDATTFCDTTKTNIAGLKTWDFSSTGFYDAGEDDEIDPNISELLGDDDSILSIFPYTYTKGNVAYAGKGVLTEFAMPKPHGEIETVNMSFSSQNSIVRGTCLVNEEATSTVTGTAYQVGAITAAQKGYAALQVMDVSGTSPTLDVKVQSDDNADFTSAEDRMTFTQVTASNQSEWKEVSGAITDDYWRVLATIGGTDTPTFDFNLIFGIL